MEKTINKVELNGYVGMDPVVKTLNDGTSLTRFSLATTNNYQNKKGEWVRDTTWHQVVLWGRGENQTDADIAKGSRVSVNGRLSQRKWVDKDGVQHSIVEVVARTIDVVKE
ncbi:MAG: single-stranded DNA-binding protein [Bacteroidota bacterium]